MGGKHDPAMRQCRPGSEQSAAEVNDLMAEVIDDRSAPRGRLLQSRYGRLCGGLSVADPPHSPMTGERLALPLRPTRPATVIQPSARDIEEVYIRLDGDVAKRGDSQD